MLPLHNQQVFREAFKRTESAHAGLLFDKFPDGWDENQNYRLADNDVKKHFLESIINKYGMAQPLLSENLNAALSRQRTLLENLGGAKLEVASDWRFVSGLGSAHPYETGFIWHRTLSVPYLPGSSVKGMMRAWAEQWGGLDDSREIDRLFGPAPERDGEDAACGALLVFDALPIIPPKLEIDILNPHYGEYYQNPINPPADYLSPIPVFFLTVAPEQKFEFFLAPRQGASHNDLKTGLNLLEEALKVLGAGGKTAVGYGVFKESKEAKKAREDKLEKERKALEKAEQETALEAEIAMQGHQGIAAEIYRKSQQENWEAKDNTERLYRGLSDYLQQIVAEADLKTKQQAIALASDIMEKRFPGIMQDPEKKVGKNKNKPAYTDKAKDIAIRINLLARSSTV
ncbi:MAG: type III-B CRISPR module RAMP protein Cmr6 [Gammaproteobacteria bacterium]